MSLQWTLSSVHDIWEANPTGSSPASQDLAQHDPLVVCWIAPRRSYCDRGHWEWGTQLVLPSDFPSPSYYWMSIERCQQALEQWHQALTNPAPLSPPSSPSSPLPWSSGPAQGVWNNTEEGWAMELHHAQPWAFRLLQDPVHPVWWLHAQGPGLDHADRFPRAYPTLELAMLEAQDFVAWRLFQHPQCNPEHVLAQARHNGKDPSLSAPAISTKLPSP